MGSQVSFTQAFLSSSVACPGRQCQQHPALVTTPLVPVWCHGATGCLQPSQSGDVSLRSPCGTHGAGPTLWVLSGRNPGLSAGRSHPWDRRLLLPGPQAEHTQLSPQQFAGGCVLAPVSSQPSGQLCVLAAAPSCFSSTCLAPWGLPS